MHEHMMRKLRTGARFEFKDKRQPAKRPNKSGVHFEIKDADKGMVSAIFARFNVKDYDGDITVPTAFEDGAEVLISAYGHRSWMGLKPVGKGVIRVEKEYAVLDGQFWMDTVEGKETFTVVKNAGSLQEWSYGFDVTKTGEVTEAMRQAGVNRVLEGLKVYEVSPVMIGAGVDTQTIDVKEEKEPPAPREDPNRSAILKEFARFEATRARLVGVVR
jgi:HK97 family phage prohead protease